ncbi:MAG: glycosyltransferase family 1 protein [Isosphaeraceae bacterium]
MRIGFDMLAVQSPHHGHRGIGRYSRDLVRAVLMRDDGHEYVLYAHAALPSEQIPTSPNALTRVIGPDSRRGEVRVGQYLDRLTRENPDDLDALVVLSPFEHWEGYQPPVPEPGGPRLATVIYDTIPFLAPEQFYAPRSMPRFYRVLESLRRYDVLLAISEATRADTTALLEVPGDRVVNISAACDARVFTPPAGPLCEADRRTLRLLGITRPFVLNVGGMDARKNPWGLIDAFAQLPGDLSLTHQLVFAFRLSPEAARKLREYAERRGVGDSVVVMGEADDRQLHVLYQRCAVYAFPSTYEGFGLPLLEALSSGAPVVAGNNSSQPEVVGDAGLLADASSPADFAAKLGRVLGDPALAADLRSRAVAQAANFSWE